MDQHQNNAKIVKAEQGGVTAESKAATVVEKKPIQLESLEGLVGVDHQKKMIENRIKVLNAWGERLTHFERVVSHQKKPENGHLKRVNESAGAVTLDHQRVINRTTQAEAEKISAEEIEVRNLTPKVDAQVSVIAEEIDQLLAEVVKTKKRGEVVEMLGNFNSMVVRVKDRNEIHHRQQVRMNELYKKRNFELLTKPSKSAPEEGQSLLKKPASEMLAEKSPFEHFNRSEDGLDVEEDKKAGEGAKKDNQAIEPKQEISASSDQSANVVIDEPLGKLYEGVINIDDKELTADKLTHMAPGGEESEQTSEES